MLCVLLFYMCIAVSRSSADIQRRLTISSAFTDEADAVSAEEVVPFSVVDEPGAVLAFFVAVGPVVGLAGLPVPESGDTKGTGSHPVTFAFSHLMDGRLTCTQARSRPAISRHFPPLCR